MFSISRVCRDRIAVMFLSILALPSASELTAQSPRFGPDSARLSLKVTTESTFDIMGQKTALSANLHVLTQVRIIARGSDTLDVSVVVDSIAFSHKSSGVDVSQAPNSTKKGDTVRFLISNRGVMLRSITADEDVVSMFAQAVTGTVVLPAQLQAGVAWETDPSTVLGITTAALNDGGKAVSATLRGAIHTTYVGDVDRDGARAWKFETTGSRGRLAASPTSVALSHAVTQMHTTGTTFIDTRGRLLFAESNTTLSVEDYTAGAGATISTTDVTSMVVERIR